jgi:hypothetical protein
MKNVRLEPRQGPVLRLVPRTSGAANGGRGASPDDQPQGASPEDMSDEALALASRAEVVALAVSAGELSSVALINRDSAAHVALVRLTGATAGVGATQLQRVADAGLASSSALLCDRVALRLPATSVLVVAW